MEGKATSSDLTNEILEYAEAKAKSAYWDKKRKAIKESLLHTLLSQEMRSVGTQEGPSIHKRERMWATIDDGHLKEADEFLKAHGCPGLFSSRTHFSKTHVSDAILSLMKQNVDIPDFIKCAPEVQLGFSAGGYTVDIERSDSNG